MENICPSYEAKIFLGLRVGYTGDVYDIAKVKNICQKYVNEIGLCVTITETNYIYKNGNEPGCIIGLINYPRFPDTIGHITFLAIELAKILMKELKQFRVTVQLPDVAILLENEDMIGGILDPQKNVS